MPTGHTNMKLQSPFPSCWILQVMLKIPDALSKTILNAVLLSNLPKALLEQQNHNLRVILTRVPGETIEPLQNANFANRLDVDLYISIHFYHEKEALPRLYLYHFVSNPISDFWAKPQKLAFHPFDQAHLQSITKTNIWGERLKDILMQDMYRRIFEVKGFFGLPFRPLIGIKSPALALEIGLKNKNEWQRYLIPISQALSNLLMVIGRQS
jgi:hypothetical protein